MEGSKIMDGSTYNSIISIIKSHQGLSINCMKLLCARFPDVLEDTLWSIISLEYQKKMKHNYVKSDAAIDRYFDLYELAIRKNDPPGIIVKLAEKEGFPPCLVAKLILTKYVEVSNFCDDGITSVNHYVNKYMRDTSSIQDPKLAYEVFLCTLYDDQYSPIVETMKSSIGQQYEIQLCRQITELKLAYRDETYLRKFGYDKTPDVKLDVPVAIDGFIIHWVESKALFGDADVHRDYMRNQYSSYWNRFGPGLVIYWFGYNESIVSPMEKRFTIRDHFPKNIMTIHLTK